MNLVYYAGGDLGSPFVEIVLGVAILGVLVVIAGTTWGLYIAITSAFQRLGERQSSRRKDEAQDE